MQPENEFLRRRRTAWAIAAVLFGGSVVNYLDRAVLGVVMPRIRRDLVLTNQQYGWVVNAFLVAYMISYVLGGRLADRFGYRRVVAFSIGAWSLAGMSHALVRGLAGLASARAVLGLGEAAFYPAAIAGIAAWFPPKDRAKAVGWLLSALSVGTLLAVPVVAWITANYGWRASFLATGAVGFLLLPPWRRLHRRTPEGPRAVCPPAQENSDSGARTPLAFVLRTRKYWCTLAARSCSDAAWYFYLFWMPGYFQEARGLSLETVGGLLWIPYLAAGAGSVAGAWFSSALIQRGFNLDRARKAVLIPSAALGALGAFSYFAGSYTAAVAIVAVALFGHQSWSSNLHTAISEISPPEHVAVLYGMTGAAGTLMGAVAQLVIGPVVDAAGYRPVFVGAGLIYVAAACLLLAGGRIEEIRPRSAALRTSL
ncbi:MAG: MFS transporter [Acidobacteria bacterium]|nr:MFS transporter [Acidobacteriota bacterium]